MPTKAPIKKAKNKATRILGQPTTRPIKKASLMSPIPIQRPLETKTISKKKAADRKADKKYPIKRLKSPIADKERKAIYMMERIMAGKTTLSGIM